MSRAADTAYQIIRAKLLQGELTAGSQLREEELAELCGVSRTPVRDALRRLEAEMLIRRSETQRIFVPEWSADEVEDIFTLRALLEGHAAALAAQRITPEEIDEMRRCNELIDRAIHASPELDAEAFVGNNRIFHSILFTAARSERLTKARSLMVEQTILHRTARNYDRKGLARSHADHEELVVAFLAKDSEWARSLLHSHILRAYHVTIRDVAGQG